MRKLASIQKIKELSPIEGRDRIVKATVEGWTIIVGKDDFKVGDLCVFFEIDSILPNVPEFELVNKRSSHLRTMKMAGVLSQGLAITVEQAKSVAKQLKHDFPNVIEVGVDLTDVLGIEKWEPKEQTPHFKKSKKTFFEWLKGLFVKPENTSFPTDLVDKTDETRVENIIDEEIHRWADEKILFTRSIKMDGSSTTWILKKKLFGFKKIMCSRNCRITKEADSYERYVDIRDKSKIFEVLETLYDLVDLSRIGLDEDDKTKIDFVCIQAELCGPGIQGNRAKLEHDSLFAFNFIVQTKKKKYKLSPKIFHYVIDLPNNDYLFIAPVLPAIYLPKTIDEFYKDCVVYYDNVRNNREPVEELKLLGEGIVYRNYSNDISFKCVNPDYLIKNKE